MSDTDAISQLILDHFEGMRWDEKSNPDWERFRRDFHPSAILCGAARPAEPKSVEAFVERMEAVAIKNLKSFEEHTATLEIMHFGNIAVALARSDMLENGSEENQDISAFLLVKSEGKWSILGHAWDQVDEDSTMPTALR
ncbi:nuclear transport factor 2 family protein [Cognatishimia maritima]|uniref:Putative lumazine-binding n=1 Tax=Cognatishimia maritima TaxID=870908 RepID=A0A1M5J872_9RHOB|nr:nuclear transport factor 2 family protein [Cognatishimia maritima]SHG36691.1 Putative lumazine-binding [Cognatishimia maritima]